MGGISPLMALDSVDDFALIPAEADSRGMTPLPWEESQDDLSLQDSSHETSRNPLRWIEKLVLSLLTAALRFAAELREPLLYSNE